MRGVGVQSTRASRPLREDSAAFRKNVCSSGRWNSTNALSNLEK